jgi:hypothetical protein
MSNHGNDLLNLHYASVVASLLGGRPQQALAAPQDAEPDAVERRESAGRRLAAMLRIRREAATRAQTGRV